MALWCKITTYTHPVPSPNVGSESSSSGTIAGAGVAGAVLLLVLLCFSTMIKCLIEKGLKECCRGGEVAHNRSNPTRRASLPVRTELQTTVGVTAPPPNAASQDLPWIGGMEEEEVEDNRNDSDAVNPMPVETDDEQPLLPN